MSKYVVSSITTRERRNKSNFVREHVLVAEQKLGRRLKKGEVVHHIDENKSNNNPDNLIVFASNADHSAYHKGCEIYEKDGIWYAKRKTLTCEWCGRKFEYQNRKIRKHIYCSHECYSKAQEKIKIDNNLVTVQDIIKQLTINNGNFLKTGKDFNVSGNALVNRLKRANLPYHSKDYKIATMF